MATMDSLHVRITTVWLHTRSDVSWSYDTTTTCKPDVKHFQCYRWPYSAQISVIY